MKRKQEKVPGFDEIVFENRNKAYGAYDLRKRYKSTTCLSTLGAILITVIPVLILSLTSKPGTATERDEIIVVIDPMDAPVETVVQPETKMPAEFIKAPKNITPVVTSDTSVITTFIPITDVITDMAANEKITDTLVNVEKTDDIVPPVTEPFIRVEEMPEFPGGESALLAFIAKNTIYPEEAIRNNITGRVILKFVVNPDGSVGRTEIIRGIDILLDQEAIRVIGTLPRFRPGKQNGIAVPVWYSVPVNFKIKEMN